MDPIIIDPPTPAKSCIIWLHGLGADATDFVDIPHCLGLPQEHSIRFVFPNAPYRKVTINGGLQQRAWYDIFSLSRRSKEDDIGLDHTCKSIDTWVAEQNIPDENILLAGFSQGGAAALYYSLSTSRQLAGAIGLSCYLPFLTHPERCPPINHPQMPILLCHGTQDAVVPLPFAESSYRFIKENTSQSDYKKYDMGHEVCQEELLAVGNFIKKHA